MVREMKQNRSGYSTSTWYQYVLQVLMSRVWKEMIRTEKKRIIVVSKKKEIITKDIDVPNGIALSEDEKSLYVNKMGILDNSPAIKKINLETNEVETFFDGKISSAKWKETLMV